MGPQPSVGPNLVRVAGSRDDFRYRNAPGDIPVFIESYRPRPPRERDPGEGVTETHPRYGQPRAKVFVGERAERQERGGYGLDRVVGQWSSAAIGLLAIARTVGLQKSGGRKTVIDVVRRGYRPTPLEKELARPGVASQEGGAYP